MYFSFKITIFFYMLLLKVNSSCVLPKILVQQESDRDIEDMTPSKEGIVYLEESRGFIYFSCISETGPIDVQYIAEELHTNSLDLVIETERTSDEFEIFVQAGSIEENFTSQYYCVHIENPCGYSEVKFTSMNNRTEAILLQHETTTVPPLKRTADMQLTIPPSDMPYGPFKRTCPFEFFVRVDFLERIMEGNCTVNYLNKKEIRAAQWIMTKTAIKTSAYLRDFTTHEACIHFLSPGDLCINCITERLTTSTLSTVAAVGKCTYLHYNAHQFFLAFLEEDFTSTIYSSWMEMHPTDMISIFTNDIITEGSSWAVTCRFPIFAFARGGKFATRREEHGNWEYTENNLSEEEFIPREQVMSLTYTLIGIEYSDFFEILCVGPIWNETNYAKKSKRIHIEKIEAPRFKTDFEEITLYENESGAVLCNLLTSYSSNSFEWSTPKDDLKEALHQFEVRNLSYLLFPTVVPAMEGTYYCDVINLRGTARKRFTILVTSRSNNWAWAFATVLTLLLLIILVYFIMKFRTHLRQNSGIKNTFVTSTLLNSEEGYGMIRTNLTNSLQVWKSQQPFRLSSNEEIGSGSFGRVYKILHTTLRKEFALKKIDVYKVLREMNWEFDGVLREMELHSDLNNENVVKFYNCWIEGPAGLCNFEIGKYEPHDWSSSQDYYVFIQLELCADSLANWLKQFKTIEERLAMVNIGDVFSQILRGVRALHRQNIIHRDIKPNNILYKIDSNSKKIWKIGDLGLSKKVVDETFLTKDKGCSLYRSPEMMSGTGNYSSKTDVFSLGLTFLEILYPFKTIDDKVSTYENLRTGDMCFGDLELAILTTLGEEKQLIGNMLHGDPEERISLESEYVRGYIKNELKI